MNNFSIFNGIKSALSSTSLASRVYFGRAKVGTQVPYATYMMISQPHNSDFGGYGHEELRFQVNNYAIGIVEAASTQAELEAKIHDCVITVEGKSFIASKTNSMLQSVEDVKGNLVYCGITEYVMFLHS